MIIAGREIKRIITSGCSFTYGQGLDNPQEESWPAQLSKLFNIDFVSLGLFGMGNEYISSSIIDYFSLNEEHKIDSLVIPCFTIYSRLEFNSVRRNKSYKDPQWTTILNGRIEHEFTQKFFEDYFIPEYYYSRYIRTIISLQSILKNWDIPYLMFEGLSGNPHKDMLKNDRIKKLIDQIDRKCWLRFTTGNLDNMTSPMNRLPDGHPNKLAYAEMANLLHKHIINNYVTEQ